MKRRILLAIIILFVLFVVGGIFFYLRNYEKNTVQEYTFSEEIHGTETQETKSATSETISIPGFEKLTMRSGQSTQNIAFDNPTENNCYFIISIILPDGTEIFRSDMLAPGERFRCIQLITIPEVGTYNDTVLRYYCYDTETLKELNGASINLTLEVKP